LKRPASKPKAKPEPKPSWRLKKTLARQFDFRPIEDEDVKYVWAAYQKGALASMGEQFAVPKMTAAEFKEAFETEVLTNYTLAWTLFANTLKGYRPAGVVLGFHSHPNPKFSPFAIIGDIIWFPWTSARNRIECGAHFFRKVDMPLVEYAHGDKTKRYFETMARHGLMRRVGTTFNVFRGEPVAVFETRRAE
jgi:hypothetical protein